MKAKMNEVQWHMTKATATVGSNLETHCNTGHACCRQPGGGQPLGHNYEYSQVSLNTYCQNKGLFLR